MTYKDAADKNAFYRAQRKADPERFLATDRRSNEKRRLRIAGRPRPPACEACGAPGGETRVEKLVPDHDHGTGKFRGWICMRCNLALGIAQDDLNRLLNLVGYLRKVGGEP